MDTLRCPYFDLLVRKLVDAYHRMEDRDILGLLAGVEIPAEIDDIHLKMAEHRETCFMCQTIDRKPRKSVLRAPAQKVEPIR